MAQEFLLTRRGEILGLKITPITFGAGIIILQVSDLFHRFAVLNTVVSGLGILMVILSPIAFLTFLIGALIVRKSVAPFSGVKSILVGSQGIVLRKKDSSEQLAITWSNVKSLEYRGVRWMWLGLVETSREPVLAKVLLKDGTVFNIPLTSLLKKRDRLSIMKAIAYYVAPTNWRVTDR